MSFQEQLELNLFQNKNYITSSTQTIAKQTQIVGSVLNRKDEEFIIESIPDNQFSVRIININGNTSTTLGDYILQLHFQKIK
jgi:hypothetical protein